MKRLVLLVALLICSSAMIAAEDAASPQKTSPQMQRIQRAQNELQEQRHQLEMERQEFERQREQMQRQGPRHKDGHKPICALLMVMCVVVHILVAIWVFQDIRTRGVGSGIWIVIALIAGLLGALVYAVVRLGDIKKA